jgi:putative ABC transport system permease protein
MLSNSLRDARIGFRLLWKNPGFAAVAALTLALGIAATTAIFSVIYATFLEPLPYRDPDRLVMVWSRIQGYRNTVAAGTFDEWKRQATVFDDLNAWGGRAVNLSAGERPEQVQAGLATPRFLPMLGYGHPLARGRDFLEEEATVGKDQVVILTHRIWRERFGADPAIVGRQIRIDRKPYTVVGVLGAGPADENQNQLYLPLVFTPEQLNHDFHWLLVMGRLKHAVTLEQANANLDAVSRNIARSYPASAGGWSATVEPFRNNFLSEDTKRGLWLLLGAVAFVLLIACANVANLLLARGAARGRELAVRSAIGASGAQVVRQLLVESLVLALIGGALGVLMAWGLLAIVVALMPPYMLPTEANVRLNVPVLLFALAACALSALVSGAAPAWQALRVNVNDTLKEAGRSPGGGTHRLRHLFVVVEFALALTLLAGGGLAVHGLFTLLNQDLGFRTERLLTFSLPLPQDRFAEQEGFDAFYRRLIERLQALPGVVSASASTGMPVRGTSAGMQFDIVGQPVADPSKRPGAGFSMVTPDYFRTFGIRITRGRAFTEHDRAGSLPVAIVNETFVRRYLASVDPLTQRLAVLQMIPGAKKLGPPIEWHIVGVYADVRNAGPGHEGFPEIDVPFSQSPWPDARLAVRTAGDPIQMQQSIAAIVQSMDADLPIADVKTMEQIVAESLVADRFSAVLFGTFAVLGLLLAAFGIYGVMSFVVSQRTHEIGLRMALGADRSRILRHVVREGMTAALIGTVVGFGGAFFVARTMRGIVSGIGDLDPTAFVVVSLLLLGAALLACVVPARRAASVDPMVALRQD